MNEIKYSNEVEIQVQLFDAQLKFNLKKGEDEIGESTTIILSPQHMKVLKYMLQDAVIRYEEQFGEITIPEMSGKN